jgi:hypothetical protein
MRSLLSILLILVITLPVMLGYSIYGFLLLESREEATREIMSRLPDNELVKITAHSGNREYLKFSWWEDHEFEYQGRMYDIVREQTKSDTTIYLCFDDSRETNVNNAHRYLAENSFSAPIHRQGTQVFKAMMLEYIIPDKTEIFILASDIVKYGAFIKLQSQKFSSINSPPPENKSFF